MTERTLIKHLRRIVYEDLAHPDMINEVVNKFRCSKKNINTTKVEDIINCSALVNSVTSESTLSRNQSRNNSDSRRFVWKYLKDNRPLMTWGNIAKLTNRKNHSTIMAGVKAINNLLCNDKGVQRKYAKFEELINERL